MLFRKRFNRVDLTVLIVVVAILLAVTIPSVRHSMRKAGIAQCGSHLRTLWSIPQAYRSSHSRLPSVTGGEYFLTLQRGPKPLIANRELFICPLSGEERYPRITSYRGPVINANKLSPDNILGADKEGNHGPGRGGNVLSMRGDVREVEVTDPLWILARQTTKE